MGANVLDDTNIDSHLVFEVLIERDHDFAQLVLEADPEAIVQTVEVLHCANDGLRAVMRVDADSQWKAGAMLGAFGKEKLEGDIARRKRRRTRAGSKALGTRGDGLVGRVWEGTVDLRYIPPDIVRTSLHCCFVAGTLGLDVRLSTAGLVVRLGVREKVGDVHDEDLKDNQASCLSL